MNSPSQQEIINSYNTMKNEQNRLLNKISELEGDLSEHKLVIKTLEKSSDDRKCFRLIGGVLVERTVSEVLPAVMNNEEGLNKVLKKLNNDLEKISNDLSSFIEKYGISNKGNYVGSEVD